MGNWAARVQPCNKGRQHFALALPFEQCKTAARRGAIVIVASFLLPQLSNVEASMLPSSRRSARGIALHKASWPLRLAHVGASIITKMLVLQSQYGYTIRYLKYTYYLEVLSSPSMIMVVLNLCVPCIVSDIYLEVRDIHYYWV